MLLRRSLVLLLTLAAGLVIPVTDSEAARPSDDFQMLYFPHDSLDVEFDNDHGYLRSRGRRHNGIDIFSPKLTPVVAVADGFVERLRTASRAGWYLKIRHADGWDSYYMHLNNDTPGTDDGRGGTELAVAEGLEVGSFVAAGQLIGFVGDSGNAEGTRPHTHFELHHNGRIRNPYPYLADAWDRTLKLHELADEVR